MRVNLSVNLVAMVPITNYTESVSQVVLDWTPYQRAYILGGYFWGYLAGNLFGGPLATQLWGSRRVIFCTTLFSAILTLLSPAAAKHSFGTMLALRILLGFSGGFLFPASYSLIANWAVPTERGKFVGALIGGSIGTFITWSLCGLLIESFGWEWGFYAFGIFALLWTIIWWFLVYDCPEVHPLISASEKEYICDGIKITKKGNVSPPIRQMLTSVPVLSLCVMSFGTGWGVYFIITAAPNYLANALGFRITATGVLSGVIYLLRSICNFLFGYLGDIALKRKLLSLRVLRKVASIFSHVIPGLLLVILAIPAFSSTVYLTIIITAMAINGFVTLSSGANGYDLTNNFIAQLGGLVTSLITFAGIISPIITAYFTKYNEVHVEAWQPVFYISSSVLVASGLQFIIFGSTEIQPWNEIKETVRERERERGRESEREQL
ncbi:unnamed protein product [Parnassius mnemosyne]